MIMSSRLYVYLLLSSLLGVAVSKDTVKGRDAVENCNLVRTTLKTGFHRDLDVHLNIVISSFTKEQKCQCKERKIKDESMPTSMLMSTDANANWEIALVQQIPNTMYIDIDQISDLNRLSVENAVSVNIVEEEKSIDIERPSDVSKSYTIVMRFRNSSVFFEKEDEEVTVLNGRAMMPFHLRYQNPSYERFRQAILPYPVVCLKCTTSPSCSSVSGWTSKSESSARNRNDELCINAISPEWFSFNPCSRIEAKQRADIVLDVPVGQLGSRDFVGCITFGITTISAMLLSGILLCGAPHLRL